MQLKMANLLGLTVLLCISVQVYSQEDVCGKTQGCFRDPQDCYPASECTYFVAWKSNDNNATLVDFELSVNVGSEDAYAAVGLSQDNQMPESDVYVCRSDEMLDRYYLEAREAPSAKSELKGVVNINVEPVVDGILRCIFSRSIELDDGDAQFFSLNEKLFVLIATGARTGDTLSYHYAKRWLTSDAVDLMSFNPAENDLSLPRAKKAHGILMVIGWMLFVSTGIVFARYMKPFLSDKTLFGNKVWFNSHRICVISGWVCFTIAFILIFVVKKEFVGSEPKSTFAHAIVGCIAVSCGTINPILALFRPHPGTPRRPYFNYAHRTIGILGWVFAMIAIILATDFYIDPVAESITDVTAFWTVISFLIIGVFILIAFEIFDCSLARKDSGQSTDIALQASGDPKPTTAPPANAAEGCRRSRTIIFTLAVLDIVICSILMVVWIGQVEI